MMAQAVTIVQNTARMVITRDGGITIVAIIGIIIHQDQVRTQEKKQESL